MVKQGEHRCFSLELRRLGSADSGSSVLGNFPRVPGFVRVRVADGFVVRLYTPFTLALHTLYTPKQGDKVDNVVAV